MFNHFNLLRLIMHLTNLNGQTKKKINREKLSPLPHRNKQIDTPKYTTATQHLNNENKIEFSLYKEERNEVYMKVTIQLR